MERDLAEGHQERADLVGDGLRQVEVPHVEERENLAALRIAHHELMGVDGVGFDADAEEL